MTVQTQYSKEANLSLPGLISDLANTNIQSYAAEGIIQYGRFVDRGTDPENQVVVATSDSDALGVSVRTASENSYNAPAGLATEYKDTDTVGVMRSGYIWLEMVTSGGSPGDPVSVSAGGKGNHAGGTPPTSISATLETPSMTIEIDGVSTFVAKVKIS